jgi:hypothetical protein
MKPEDLEKTKGHGVLRNFQQYFSYIVSVLLGEKTGVSGENHRPVEDADKLYHCQEDL